MTDNPRTAIAYGCSCRALAFSAKQAGLNVVAFDQFQDRDLQQIAATFPYEQLALKASSFEGSYFLAAGNAEHTTASLEELCAEYSWQSLGPSPKQMQQLRDRSAWQRWCQANAIGYPTTLNVSSGQRPSEVLADSALNFDFESWIWKPADGAGGWRNRLIKAEEEVMEEGYLQAIVEGRQLSTVILASRHGIEVLPTMESLTASHSLAKELACPFPFGYRGSWGPVTTEWDMAHRWHAFGDHVGKEVGWNGWMQIDWILDRDGYPWMLEINPRWSASMELLERALNRNWVAEAMTSRPLAPDVALPKSAIPSNGYWGKTILYNTHCQRLDSRVSELLWDQSWIAAEPRLASQIESPSRDQEQSFWLADLPIAEQTLSIGAPLLTILACGGSLVEVEQRLAIGAKWVRGITYLEKPQRTQSFKGTEYERETTERPD